MADNDRIKELMAGAEESPLLRYFKDEGERILQRNREEDWAKSRASAEAYKQKTFAEGAKKFFGSAKEAAPSKASIKRYGNRLGKGLLLAGEEAVVAALAPDEAASEFLSSASEIGELLQSAGGRETLRESMHRRADAVVRSPEAAADATVNLAAAVAARKMPIFKNMDADDVMVAIKMAKDVASTDYEHPLPVLGEALKKQLTRPKSEQFWWKVAQEQAKARSADPAAFF